jgi:CDP-diacylglycerol--serine O-phosphatidyltransferase
MKIFLFLLPFCYMTHNFRMKRIPNFITSLNLGSGFLAIIFAGNGDLFTASWLIVAAMVFDFLDGFSARLLHAYSDVGKELDSLADVVSFGVAPALIIFHLLNESLFKSVPLTFRADVLNHIILYLVSAGMPVCAALRLAVFNIDETQSTTFKGLPTPANALAVISIIIASHYSGSEIFSTITASPVFLVSYAVILSLLMVSRLPLLSLKVSNLAFKGNEGRYIIVALILISFAVLGISAAPFIIPIYIAVSLLSLAF